MNQTCKECGKNFKVITKEKLCVFCFKNKFGRWSLEFSDYTKDKKGNLMSNEGPMKFRKTKKKK